MENTSDKVILISSDKKSIEFSSKLREFSKDVVGQSNEGEDLPVDM